jgi:ABC-2 type transport system permease protein
VLAYLLVVVLQMALLFGVGAIFMGMSLGNSPFGLILITLVLGLAATTLGMVIAALARSIDQAGYIALLLIFVLGFLSGSFNPGSAPYRGEGLVAAISHYLPQSQATMAYHTLLLQNGGLIDILPQVAYPIGLSLVLFLIAVWHFKFE